MPKLSKPLRYALGSLGVLLIASLLSRLNGWGLPAENEAAIGEVSRWCERVSDGLLREPVNTLGNLGFVVSGLAMLYVLGNDEKLQRLRRNRFIGHTPLSLLYAGAALFLGPGSMAMHGTHTRFGAWLDNVSMVAYILVPWLLNVSIMGRWSQRQLFATYGGLLTSYALGYWFIGSDLGIGLDMFGVSIALWIISEALYRFHSQAMRWGSGLVGFAVGAVFGVTPAVIFEDLPNHWWIVLFWLPGLLSPTAPPGRRRYIPWYWIGMAAFIVAYAVWLTGTADHPACRPDSIWQPHAIWHLLGAVSTWSFFVFLRTEQPTDHDSAVETSRGDGR